MVIYITKTKPRGRREGEEGGRRKGKTLFTHDMRRRLLKNRLHEVVTLLYLKIDLSTYDITQEPAINRCFGLHARHSQHKYI